MNKRHLYFKKFIFRSHQPYSNKLKRGVCFVKRQGSVTRQDYVEMMSFVTKSLIEASHVAHGLCGQQGIYPACSDLPSKSADVKCGCRGRGFRDDASHYRRSCR